MQHLVHVYVNATSSQVVILQAALQNWEGYCRLKTHLSDLKEMDALRYKLASTTDSSAANLPPTEYAFQQHVSRAMYQTAVCGVTATWPSLISGTLLVEGGDSEKIDLLNW